MSIEDRIKQRKAKNDTLTALSKAADVCFEAHAMMKSGAEDDALGAINRAMTLLNHGGDADQDRRKLKANLNHGSLSREPRRSWWPIPR
jgi:hypothetical protein